MKYQFRYIKIGSYYRPIIPIALRDGNKIVDFHALIDSSADFNLFPGRIADILGLDVRHMKSEQVSGVAGSAEAFPYALDVGIQDHFYRAPLVFSYEITLDHFGLLGQRGFFDRFVVEFNYTKGHILLK